MIAKKWMVMIFLLSALGMAFGQGARVMELRAGYFNPKGTAAGLIFGGSYGVCIDERVDMSLGVSYFRKKYTQETVVADSVSTSGITERTVMREMDYSTTLLPISANINIRFSLDPRGYNPRIFWFVGGSVSYQFLFNTENNYIKEEKKSYKGWGWIARAGIEYGIGSHSSLILEAFYNSCKVKGNKEKELGFPVWDEVDVSGLGFRAGLRLEFL